jgi:hypothetical protein
MYGETPRAFLLLIEGQEMWFPKRFCRNFILNKKLGGNMEIPAWLYREKFGREPDEEDATLIVEHHIPEPIEPKNIEPLKELSR